MKRTIGINIVLVIGTLLLASGSFAGASGKGGADAIQCSNVPFLRIGGSSATLADVVGSTSMFDTRYYAALTLDQARDGVLKFIQKYRASDSAAVEQALSKILPLKFVNTPLPKLNTGATPNLIHQLLGCDKQQLAIQNLTTNEVQVYKTNYDRLSVIEQALLEIHEAFIFIASQKSGDLIELEKFARGKVYDMFNDPYFHEVMDVRGYSSYLGTVTARKIVSLATDSDCWDCSIRQVGGVNEWAVRNYLHQAGFATCPRSVTGTPSGSLRLYEYVMRIQNCRDDGKRK